MRGKAGLTILLAVLFISRVSNGSVELAGEGFIPEPNQEITVQIQTDTPLGCMGLGITVTGDATITDAMSTADCNIYGWDPDWPTDPYIDPEGWVYVSGVKWEGEANGVVGYLKFIYNSGEVSVSITEGDAFDADCEPVPISDKTLVFGEPDPNNYGRENASSSQIAVTDENTPATAESPNDVNLPINSYWQNKLAERQQHLMLCPAGSDSSKETFSSTTYEQWAQKNSEEKLESESMKESKDGRQMLMELDDIIEINSDITTNQIWTANNIYYVTNWVNVQALLVIEPGTVIYFSYYGALFINSGGTLISSGTPDNPIIYTSDTGYGWGDYYCAIYIEQTASPATKVTYSYVDCAYVAIVTDNIRLDSPIENNYLFYNAWGIYEFGTHHTDIMNNQIFCSYYSGIETYMESYGGVADANSFILIQNNTCDYYQDNGIYVHGTEDANNASVVVLANNIVSESYWFGLHLCDPCEWVVGIVTNTGYYDNPYNKNWGFNEYSPVEANDFPYIFGLGPPGLEDFYQAYYGDDFWVPYLDWGCPFIDAGLGYVEETALIGKTTDINGMPDSNVIDIGFHNPNWDYSNAGVGDYYAGDLDKNLVVDFKDFAILANGWCQEYDANDLAQMCSNWLMMGGPDPNIVPSFDKDPNNISGHVQITVNVNNPMIHRVFLMLDGEKYCEFGDLEDGSPVGIDTERFANGNHSIKIVCMYEDQVIASTTIPVIFNNQLHCLTQSDGFTPGKDFYLYALADGNYSVEMTDIINNDEVVYADTFENGINAHIDSNVFSEPYGVYKITATEAGGMLTMGAGDSFSVTVGREFRMQDFPPDCNSKMVVSIGSEDLERLKEKCWQAALRAGINKQFNPILLRYKDCTWDNLSYCLHLNNVKIWYHCAHGNYDLVGQPPRQCIKTADGWVFSYLRKDFNSVPPNYQNLWWFYEDNHSLAELGFWNTHKLNWVQFNACYSAHTPEFPFYLGILEGEWPGNPLGSRIFIGWKESAKASDFLTANNQFEEDYWEKLRQGDMLHDAVFWSLPSQGGTNILENFGFWGANWDYVWFRYPNIN